MRIKTASQIKGDSNLKTATTSKRPENKTNFCSRKRSKQILSEIIEDKGVQKDKPDINLRIDSAVEDFSFQDECNNVSGELAISTSPVNGNNIVWENINNSDEDMPIYIHNSKSQLKEELKSYLNSWEARHFLEKKVSYHGNCYLLNINLARLKLDFKEFKEKIIQFLEEVGSKQTKSSLVEFTLKYWIVEEVSNSVRAWFVLVMFPVHLSRKIKVLQEFRALANSIYNFPRKQTKLSILSSFRRGLANIFKLSPSEDRYYTNDKNFQWGFVKLLSELHPVYNTYKDNYKKQKSLGNKEIQLTKIVQDEADKHATWLDFKLMILDDPTLSHLVDLMVLRSKYFSDMFSKIRRSEKVEAEPEGNVVIKSQSLQQEKKSIKKLPENKTKSGTKTRGKPKKESHASQETSSVDFQEEVDLKGNLTHSEIPKTMTFDEFLLTRKLMRKVNGQNKFTLQDFLWLGDSYNQSLKRSLREQHSQSDSKILQHHEKGLSNKIGSKTPCKRPYSQIQSRSPTPIKKVLLDQGQRTPQKPLFVLENGYLTKKYE